MDAAREHQPIRGFGASSAWYSHSLTEQLADELFSESSGLGLSLLRLRITPDGTTEESATAAQAQARGALVWAAPWSPPGEWKSNGSDRNGGKLLPEYYDDWADRLASFAKGQAEAGVPLFALSAQNEPNWSAEWETCEWTPDELVTFVRDYLGPALREKSPGTVLMAPETIDWFTVQRYADALMADPGANEAVGIIAVHAYGGAPFPYPAPQENGKEYWETEVSYHSQTGMPAGLETARQIHAHLTVANVNAWHYWWILSESDSSLIRDGVMTRQAYALGQYSKFVRPGAVRIEAVAETRTAGVLVSAFRHEEPEGVVLVLVNSNETEVEQTFTFEGLAAPATLFPYVTTDTLAIARRDPIAAGTSFSYRLDPLSVTTLTSREPGASGPGGGAGAGDGGRDNFGGESSEGGVSGLPSSAGAPAGGRAGASGRAGQGGTLHASGGVAAGAGAAAGSLVSSGSSGMGGSPDTSSGHAGARSRGPGVTVSPLGCSAAPSPAPFSGAPWLAPLALAVAARRRRSQSATRA